MGIGSPHQRALLMQTWTAGGAGEQHLHSFTDAAQRGSTALLAWSAPDLTFASELTSLLTATRAGPIGAAPSLPSKAAAALYQTFGRERRARCTPVCSGERNSNKQQRAIAAASAHAHTARRHTSFCSSILTSCLVSSKSTGASQCVRVHAHARVSACERV
jgi:hypothetical protein